MPMPDQSIKPQLHSSQLSTLTVCGEQYRRRYIEGEIVPPSSALLIGTATHGSVEKNLRHKVQTGGELLAIDEVKSIAADTFSSQWDNGVRLDDEEVELGEKVVRGQTLDTVVGLAALHATDLAPEIQPVSENHIERKFVVELTGFPFDLAGKIDIQEEKRIRDTKTASKTPTQGDADGSEQLTMYALGAHVIDKLPMPVEVRLDSLVKTKTPKAVSVSSVRTDDNVTRLLRRIERAAEVIEKGMFMPASAGDWRCSARYCGYAHSCPFWSGRP